MYWVVAAMLSQTKGADQEPPVADTLLRDKRYSMMDPSHKHSRMNVGCEVTWAQPYNDVFRSQICKRKVH